MLTIESLTLNNAKAALEQGVAALKAGQTVFDLGNVKLADSSAVAVLLAWQRAARQAGVALSYVNVPANVHSLASLYDVDTVLCGSSATPHHH